MIMILTTIVTISLGRLRFGSGSSCEPAPFHVHPVRNPRFGSFRTQPLENLSAAVKLPIKNGFWATQPLDKTLVAEILVCELGVGGTPRSCNT